MSEIKKKDLYFDSLVIQTNRAIVIAKYWQQKSDSLLKNCK